MDVRARLEYLRGEIRAERISQGELHELQGLAGHIEPGDTELAEWAGIPEEEFMARSSEDLKVGDKIRGKFGPYSATGTVTEIKAAGAVVRWEGTALFVGFDALSTAPNGDQLTTDTADDFIGRAHWPAVERVQ